MTPSGNAPSVPDPLGKPDPGGMVMPGLTSGISGTDGSIATPELVCVGREEPTPDKPEACEVWDNAEEECDAWAECVAPEE